MRQMKTAGGYSNKFQEDIANELILSDLLAASRELGHALRGDAAGKVEQVALDDVPHSIKTTAPDFILFDDGDNLHITIISEAGRKAWSKKLTPRGRSRGCDAATHIVIGSRLETVNPGFGHFNVPKFITAMAKENPTLAYGVASSCDCGYKD
jgi:hypothetical protein